MMPNPTVCSLLVRFSPGRARQINSDVAEEGGEVDHRHIVELTELGEHAIWLKTLLALGESDTDFCMQDVVTAAWNRAQRNRVLTLRGVHRLMQGPAKQIWKLWMQEQPQILEQMLDKLKALLRDVK